MSVMSDLELLPADIAKISISDDEIVLPMEQALVAIDLLEKRGIRVVGWEGWIKDREGDIGHSNAPQGTVSLAHLSVSQAAEVCRRTIREEGEKWRRENLNSPDELYFCITCEK